MEEEEGAVNESVVSPTADDASGESLESTSQESDDQGTGTPDATATEAGKEGGDDDRSPFIPRQRFDEINDKYTKEALPKAQRYDAVEELFCREVPGLRETLAAGVPLDKALQDIAAQNARRSQIEQQAHATIAEQHSAVDGALTRGEVTEEWANWAKQQITANAYAQPQIAATEQQQALQRVETIQKGILKDFPEADEDSVRDYLLAGQFDVARQRAEKQHTKVIKAKADAEARAATAVADYEAANAKRSTAVQPERGNSRVPDKVSPTAKIENMTDTEFQKWMQAQGRKTDLARSQ